MQDAITSIMAAEHEAKRLVDEADAERTRIIREAQNKADEMATQAHRETRKEAEQFVADAVREAEREKQEKLVHIKTEIENQIHLDDAYLRKAIDMVVRSVRGEK